MTQYSLPINIYPPACLYHVYHYDLPCSGSLLVTASSEGHSFNVFHLIPHPWLSGETAVHHIYTLFRGATSACVQDITVSGDSRWVAVSTLNGTTHIFPITPYGGEISVRTHSSNRVVNKMSRFHTSAGIETMTVQSHSYVSVPSPSTGTTTASSTTHSLNSPPHESHLADSTHQPITWNNPRGIPLPSPITVKALHQIKQPYLTTDGIFCVVARATYSGARFSSEGSRVSGGVATGTGSAPSLPSGDPSNPWTETQCVRTFFTPFHHNEDRNSTGVALVLWFLIMRTQRTQARHWC